jgi:hypothetical protein
MCPVIVAVKRSPARGIWPLQILPSVVIHMLRPSGAVSATTDADWPVVVETIVPFAIPGVELSTGGGRVPGPSLPPPPPPQPARRRLTATSGDIARGSLR